MKPITILLCLLFSTFATVSAGEKRVQISIVISGDAPEVTRVGLFCRKTVTARPGDVEGVHLVWNGVAGRKARFRSMKEAITPTAYDDPEIFEGTRLDRRADGVNVLSGVDLKKFEGAEGVTSFPVTPATPKAFKRIKVGWEFEGTPTIREDGLIQLEATVRHTGISVDQSVFGEGSGPIVVEHERKLIGKKIDIVMTENREEMMATCVTEMPLIVRAKPGVTYDIVVKAFGRAIPAKITCDWPSSESAKNPSGT
jgi:hypothetical protein